MFTLPQLGNPKAFQQVLQTTTVRSFDGGWNVIDTDLNLEPKYAKILDNMERGLDGTLAIRPGTKLFSVLIGNSDTTAVVNHCYFNNVIIAVQAGGTVSLIDGAGTASPMFISPATTNAWGAVFTTVTFTIFNSDLIICNGVDKPLIIAGKTTNANYMQLQFLADLASLSNVNTPVGKFVIAHAQYTIIAGLPAAMSSIAISARGTSGTYVGDGAPNDAILLDLGPRVSLGGSDITGMVAYRDKLLVTFERGVLPLNLGIYTGSPAVHTPSDDGFIEEFGCIAHRSLLSVGDDTFYCDNIGVNSISRSTLYNTLRPERPSQLIDPAIIALIQPLSRAQIEQYVFGIYDMRNKRYMLFVPVFDTDGTTLLETIGFSYTSIPVMKVEAWARLRGWKWNSGCRTALQNIIFSQGNKLFTYNFDDADTNVADFVNDPDANADLTGVPVAFNWELPWSSFKQRMKLKETKYLSLETTGKSEFTVSMYVDNIRRDRDGNDAPLLSLGFVGGSAGGYGESDYGSSEYGAGRLTSDERLFAWPATFKISKFRISGLTKLPLKFVSISVGWLMGNIRR